MKPKVMQLFLTRPTWPVIGCYVVAGVVLLKLWSGWATWQQPPGSVLVYTGMVEYVNPYPGSGPQEGIELILNVGYTGFDLESQSNTPLPDVQPGDQVTVWVGYLVENPDGPGNAVYKLQSTRGTWVDAAHLKDLNQPQPVSPPTVLIGPALVVGLLLGLVGVVGGYRRFIIGYPPRPSTLRRLLFPRYLAALNAGAESHGVEPMPQLETWIAVGLASAIAVACLGVCGNMLSHIYIS